ncbi:MAG: CPBP family intramembrane glutamic endopeptidase [Candidatus Bathyarchaeia archaeon]
MTIGLSRQNLFSSTLLGVLLGGINILSYAIAFNKLNVIVGGLQLYHLYYFIYTLCIGFTEEAIFRGYLHLRFTAWLGASRGLVLTALLFAIGHIGSTIPNVISTFIFGLITGWIMQKSQNIVGLSIWHAFQDWVWVLYYA